MIHATRAAVRKWLEALLHVHDSPHRTAVAFALGIFLGFSPFLGLHTVLGIALAFLFNLNRVAVLLGIYSDLPWIMAEWYALMTAFGAWLLGAKPPPGFYGKLQQLFTLSLLGGEFWHRLITLLRPLLWPYVVGSIIGAAVLAAVSYPVARTFIETGRRYIVHRHAHLHADTPDGHAR